MVERINPPENSEERFREAISHLKDLMAKAKDLYAAQFGNTLGLSLEQNELAKRLEIKPNSNSYQALHVLIGSGQATDCTVFDFPDKDSIVVFFENLINELEQAEKRPANAKFSRSESERILRQRKAEESAILEKAQDAFPQIKSETVVELIELKQIAAAHKTTPKLLAALAQFKKDNPEADKFLAFIIVSKDIQAILDSKPDQFDYPDNRILNFLKNWKLEMAKIASLEDIAQRFGLALEYVQEPSRIIQAAINANKASEFQIAMVQFVFSHPDASNHVAFHLAMGSSIRISDLDLMSFDYPEGDIIQYIRDWEDENLKV